MSSLVEARKKTDWFIELDTMFLYTISRRDLSKIVLEQWNKETNVFWAMGMHHKNHLFQTSYLQNTDKICSKN